MPPAAYGVPAIRAANSWARSPANTRWECESTKPGITARPPASTSTSASGASDAGPVQATRSPSSTRAASTTRPSGSSRVLRAGSLVTSSPMPVITVLVIPGSPREREPEERRGGGERSRGVGSCPQPSDRGVELAADLRPVVLLEHDLAVGHHPDDVG